MVSARAVRVTNEGHKQTLDEGDDNSYNTLVSCGFISSEDSVDAYLCTEMHNPGHPARLGWGAGTNQKKRKWAAALSILVTLLLDRKSIIDDDFPELAVFLKKAAAKRPPAVSS